MQVSAHPGSDEAARELPRRSRLHLRTSGEQRGELQAGLRWRSRSRAAEVSPQPKAGPRRVVLKRLLRPVAQMGPCGVPSGHWCPRGRPDFEANLNPGRECKRCVSRGVALERVVVRLGLACAAGDRRPLIDFLRAWKEGLVALQVGSMAATSCELIAKSRLAARRWTQGLRATPALRRPQPCRSAEAHSLATASLPSQESWTVEPPRPPPSRRGGSLLVGLER